jgi:GNAT superfamily N-acetyltransferase
VTIRIAEESDIPQMHAIRMGVKENKLSDPSRITFSDYQTYLTGQGQGWVCLLEDQMAGFAIVDWTSHNVWALFVHPEREGRGVGRLLHDTMLDAYFSRTTKTLWLSTSPGTRAEQFYRKAGWLATGMLKDEVRFEMPHASWQQVRDGF